MWFLGLGVWWLDFLFFFFIIEVSEVVEVVEVGNLVVFSREEGVF